METESKMESLANPFFENVNVPMCLVSAGPDKFIGGLFDLDGGNCTLGLPLRYMEIYRQDDKGQINVDMMMNKVYAYIGIMQELNVNFDTIYLLHAENKEDEALTQLYYDRYQEIKKRDAGKIEVKEQPRIIIPGVNDIVASNRGKVK